LFIIGALATTAAMAQNQYFVSPSGSGTTCSNGAPCSPATAIANFSLANPGGAVINFAVGNYNQTLAVSRGGSSTGIRLVLKCSATVVINGANNCRGILFQVFNVNNVDIQDFEYTNTSGQVFIQDPAQCSSGTTCPNGNSIHMIHNWVHDLSTGVCNPSGALLAGQHGHPATDIQAIGNVLDNVGPFGQTCSEMQGLYVIGTGARFQNNIITRVAAGGIQYYDASCLGVITNNVIVHNNFGIISYGSNGCTAGFNTISNNVLSNNNVGFYNGFSAPAGDCVSGQNTLFSNNIMFGNGANFQQGQPSCEIRQNQLSENPTTTFVNYTGDDAGNYHLKAGSVGIAGGTSSCVSGGINPCVPSVDQGGIARPSGGAQDIGVFVFSSGGAPLVNFAPSPLNYGTVGVSTPSALTATLTNTGTANLTFSAATISGTNAGDFAVTSTTCASPLLQGASCTYSLTFTPQATGIRSANLTLNDNASGSPHLLPLAGTGGTGTAALTPSPAAFGIVVPGQCSVAQFITLTNTGSASFNQNANSTITPNQNEFKFVLPIGTCANGTLAPGASCTTNVQFCPTVVGARTATFNAFTTANNPTDVLNGTGGAPVVTLSPSSANCGTVQIGTSVTCQAFTLTNTGNSDLTNIVVSIP
jgi:hypothetical protein